jgi:uncharacterized protein YlaN (UPF0358 family)
MLFKRKTIEEKEIEKAKKYINNFIKKRGLDYPYLENSLCDLILENENEYIQLEALKNIKYLSKLIKLLPVDSKIRKIVKERVNNDIEYYTVIYMWEPDTKNYSIFHPINSSINGRKIELFKEIQDKDLLIELYKNLEHLGRCKRFFIENNLLPKEVLENVEPYPGVFCRNCAKRVTTHFEEQTDVDGNGFTAELCDNCGTYLSGSR